MFVRTKPRLANHVSDLEQVSRHVVLCVHNHLRPLAGKTERQYASIDGGPVVPVVLRDVCDGVEIHLACRGAIEVGAVEERLVVDDGEAAVFVAGIELHRVLAENAGGIGEVVALADQRGEGRASGLSV